MPPVWAPDSQSVYFVHQTSDTWRVMRQSVMGGESPEDLAVEGSSGPISIQDVSPDGTQLLLSRLQGGGLHRLDLTKAREDRHIERVVATGVRGRISPDGRSVVFMDQETAYGLSSLSAHEAPREIATFGGPAWPFFNHDGRKLYFISEESLHSYSVVPGSGGNRLDEHSILFRLHHPTRADSNIGAVTRDGQRFLAIATDREAEAQVQILSDWTSLLDKPENRSK